MTKNILKLFIYSPFILFIGCSAYKPTHLELAEEFISVSESSLRNAAVARNFTGTKNEKNLYKNGEKKMTEVVHSSYQSANYHLSKVDSSKLKKDEQVKLKNLVHRLQTIKKKL